MIISTPIPLQHPRVPSDTPLPNFLSFFYNPLSSVSDARGSVGGATHRSMGTQTVSMPSEIVVSPSTAPSTFQELLSKG